MPRGAITTMKIFNIVNNSILLHIQVNRVIKVYIRIFNLIDRFIIITMLTKLLVFLLVVSALGAPDWTKVNDLFKELINERAIPGGIVTVAN